MHFLCASGTRKMNHVDGETIYKIALGKDHRPDPWQQSLMSEAWPRVLVAPTGSGKTAAVTLGWVAHRVRDPDRTPRRLVWCLPMRTLVEQTAEAVRNWVTELADSPAASGSLPSPDDVHVLMGGLMARTWIEQPERPSVVVGTQDMLLSRALMRGYASSRANWPMEFALLHDDAQWVFDEVQLMGAGRATSTQLEAFRQDEAASAQSNGRAFGRPARTLWISATLQPKWLATVDHPEPVIQDVKYVDALSTETGRLARLARARKSLDRSDLEPPASANVADIKLYVNTLASKIRNAHRPGHLTLAIINRVDRAQQIFDALRMSTPSQGGPRLALVHSRFRPNDRKREMAKLIDRNNRDLIVVSTQAVEAGVDVSAAVLFTELAPWSSMVQRFGRANRYAELDDGANIHWIDMLGEAREGDKVAIELAKPYEVGELKKVRKRLASLTDAAPKHLTPPDKFDLPLRVIRRKDLDDLFDTDPDLTGFDVDISPYIRDADDTDVHIFWRDLSDTLIEPPRPSSQELCAAPIGQVKDWLNKARRKRGTLVFVRDPQWRRGDASPGGAPAGWTALREDPWPGVTLLVDVKAGGYADAIGFTGDLKSAAREIKVEADVAQDSTSKADEDGHDDDPRSATGVAVPLGDHLEHVALEAKALCDALAVDQETRKAIVRAARWHDLGKAHSVFQDTMQRGLNGRDATVSGLLAKTIKSNLRHDRPYFRHELASTLAFLASEDWSRDADLVAYLIASHHGKVRMNLRALPRERTPDGQQAGGRFARGVWDGDELRPVDIGAGERWNGGLLTLSIMELGWDENTRESWTERTHDLLVRFGPFRLAWMETILRLADWRASKKEREGHYSNG